MAGGREETNGDKWDQRGINEVGQVALPNLWGPAADTSGALTAGTDKRMQTDVMWQAALVWASTSLR